MRRRHKDIWDQPWVMIAIVVGIIAVLAIALVVFFSGSSAGPSPATTPGIAVTTTPAGSGSSVPLVTTVKTTPSVTGTSGVTLAETTAVSVPTEGIFVKTSYLGGYSGKYGVTGALESIRGSGDRVYPVNATGGTVQATFQKLDSSTRHDLIVEIWKGGKAVISQKNSSAYGIVSISSAI
jgi:hypothetical protein